MSGMHDNAIDALETLLAELPAEFSTDPSTVEHTRTEFRVIKQRNVRRVHDSLWELQKYFGLTDF